MAGPNWVGLEIQTERDIDLPTDYIRLELETGLKERIPLLPVLVEGGKFPEKHELPDSIKTFADVKMRGLARPNPFFENDIQELIKTVKIIFDYHGEDFGIGKNFGEDFGKG